MINPSEIKKLVSKHGDCENQPPEAWNGNIELPNQIVKYYKEIGPKSITINSFGNPIYFPGLEDLWAFQEGYRWNGVTGERIEGWNSNWIVIASEGGDPYIFIDGKIYFAFHGEGSWEPDEMYSNLNCMIACIATLGKIMNDAGLNFEDEDGFVNKKYFKEAVSKITLLLGSQDDAELLIERYGWE